MLDHNLQTKFPLIGKHNDTKCEKCHKEKKYRTKAEKCLDCHKDPHKGEYKEECSSCHTQFDWLPRKFDHKKKTGFQLYGVHNDVICANCHLAK
ncbi:MAG: cytochrome C, partial [Deltaproteobacteria bacterium]|nr:cytochrome C [Deltaproteobacteria bacterium]